MPSLKQSTLESDAVTSRFEFRERSILPQLLRVGKTRCEVAFWTSFKAILLILHKATISTSGLKDVTSKVEEIVMENRCRSGLHSLSQRRTRKHIYIFESEDKVDAGQEMRVGKRREDVESIKEVLKKVKGQKKYENQYMKNKMNK